MYKVDKKLFTQMQMINFLVKYFVKKGTLFHVKLTCLGMDGVNKMEGPE